MTDVVQVALIAAVPATIGALVGLVNGGRLKGLHYELNSRLDELLATTRRLSHAEGVESEKLRARAERPTP